MIYFLMPLTISKAIFLGLSNVPQCLSYHAFQHSLVQKYIYNTKIFNPSAHNVPYFTFLVSLNIVFNTFTPSCLDVFYCLKKKKIMSNLVPMVFSTCFFNTLLLLIGFRSFPNQNTTLNLD
jgi:hypothetical protein